jgi:hypothetical protein
MGNLAHTPRAGAGRPPKEDRSTARNRNEIKGWVEVEDKPFEAGSTRKLPDTPLGFEWAEQTLEWWGHVRTMPHAALWSESDWDYAKATAFVHTLLWNGHVTAAAELRQRERLMGITWESRRAASIRYVPAAPAAPEGTTVVPTPLRAPRLRAIDPDAR